MVGSANARAPDDETPRQLAAPPVMAVVVAHNPGDWFEETLASLARQDYPTLSVLVVDAASREPVGARVTPILPEAYIHRINRNPGFGVAANEALQAVEGVAFLLLCHDDVALEPSAVRVMVEEAYRSNAGVVGPKLVQWDDPRRLLSVGLSADKTGYPSSPVDRGELDQEQHDAVRDVFVVPGAATLVRADLFSALGGFDRAIPLLGEDLDLCWRAQVAGARVLVAPSAVVRHREALGERRRVDDRRQLQARHRLRTMITCYSWFNLLRVVPFAVVFGLLEILYALVSGRWAQARDVAGAWGWNFRHTRSLFRNRRALRRVRRLPDREVRRLQVGGSARMGAYLRGQIGRTDDRLRSFTAVGRSAAEAIRGGQHRAAIAGWALVLAVFLLGSRLIITDGLVPFGDLPAFPSSPFSLLREWVSGYREAGLGSEAPAPTAFGLLGAAGVLVVGQMGLLRTLLVVAMLPLGFAGTWHMTRGLHPSRARAVALAVYAAIPVPYNAIAQGRWGGLVAWAATPWLMAQLSRAVGARPFLDHVSTRRRTLALGLTTTLVAAVTPAIVAGLAVLAAGLAAGGMLAGRRARGNPRTLATAFGAVVMAAVLHLPWTFDLIRPGADWAPFGGVKSAGAFPFIDLLRFQTGPLGAGALGWVFLIAASLPLFIGRAWRLAWAVRAWSVAVLSWCVLWVGQQDWFGLGLGDPEVFLAPAAAGLALSAALGLVAFEADLPGYHFGWRQLASVVAAGAATLGAFPVLGAVLNGRWNAPTIGFGRVLGFLDHEQRDDGPFRVLWMGDPKVLPLAGSNLGDGLAYGVSNGGLPRVQERWAASSDGANRLVADVVAIAKRRESSRLGRLLAPMGIRYVVLPQATGPTSEETAPVPDDLIAALGEQLDLSEVEIDARLRVFRNSAWAPARSVVADARSLTLESKDTFLGSATFTDLHQAAPVLVERDGFARYAGPLSPGAVYVASAASPRWDLTVEGTSMRRADAFGWANVFSVDRGGDATLRYKTPPWRYGRLGLQGLLWAAVIVALRRVRRRERARARGTA